MDTPLISVIVPIYNVEKVLCRCLDSIISQTYTNLEIILVDDGSPDGCGAICDDYAKKDKRITVIHQKNGGLSAARNAGIDKSTGDYLAFIDSDDYVSADYIEFMYSLLTENGADISACGAMEVYQSGKSAVQWTDDSLALFDNREGLLRMCYNEGFFVTAWDKLYKRELFDGIRYNVGKQFEDTGTTYKLVDRANKIAAKCEPKYYYVLNANSITNNKFSAKKLDYVEMADEMAEYIINKYPELEKAARRKQMHACFSTLTQLVNSKAKEPQIRKMLLSRIRALEKTALADPKTPSRDRIAIYALRLGYPVFSVVWRIYLKIKKG